MTTEPEWLDTHQAAAIIGIDSGLLRRWRSEGRGPAYRRYRHHYVRYHRADIDAWAAETGWWNGITPAAPLVAER